MKMDQYYNIESDADKYSDSFDEIVDLVVQAKEAKKIDEQQARLLLNLAAKKQNQREIKSFFSSLIGRKRIAEKNTLFIHLKTKNTEYAQ